MGHFRKASWWVFCPHDILRLSESCWEMCPLAPGACSHFQTAPGKTAAHIGDAFYHQSWHLCVCVLSHIRFRTTSWTVALQAPLSTGFPRQESWSGLPFPSPEDLPDPWIEPRSPPLQANSLPPEPHKPSHLCQTKIISDFSPFAPIPLPT